GLTQASANAQDGISSVQTAEGALTEVHDMLQRMNELAVKAANGTNSEDDRAYIQAEVDQLVTEIDRVSTTTKFNETYLLKGVDSEGNVGGLKYTDAKSGVGLGTDEEFDKNGEFAKVGEDGSVENDAALTGTTSTADKATIEVNGVTYTYLSNFTQGTGETDKITDYADKAGKVFTSLAEMAAAIKSDNAENIKAVNVTVDDAGKLTANLTAFADLNKGLDVSLHVGADSTKDNKIGLTIEMMSARGLGVNGLRVDGATDANATESIDTIKAAIQKVSEQRSALGAVQNRLEHTIANLDNIVENTTSAESAIRDTDMATQMVQYSNNNILAQAGQAMLAQANQSNQGVLSLLQ
nr:flagellin [Lachnospiraceae bacterium]